MRFVISNATRNMLHLDATPRTLAGLAAQLVFAAEYLAPGIPLYDDGPLFDESTRLLLLLVNAARMIDASRVSKIGLSEGLAKILSYEEQPV
jgi:hypothetical protein